MAKQTRHTTADDAPLSSAKKPDPQALEGGDRDIDGTVVGRTVTIALPRAVVYSFWRDLGNLPLFMENVEAVEPTGPQTSRWTLRGPFEKPVSWESRITLDDPEREIAWESVGSAELEHRGRITFTDSAAGRGTQVTATLVYRAPGGPLGRLVAKVLRHDPKVQTRRDLRRLKQLLETGEVATAEPGAAAPRAE